MVLYQIKYAQVFPLLSLVLHESDRNIFQVNIIRAATCLLLNIC